VAVGGWQSGRKPPSCIVKLSRRRTEHSCFWAILGPSMVDLVAAHGGRGVGEAGGSRCWQWGTVAVNHREN